MVGQPNKVGDDVDVIEKLKILSDAAKYDVSCSSSGGRRKNTKKGIGNSAYSGICHSWSEDGRCISLLKILMTNHCIYDCDYCINRRTNERRRAMFTVDEIVDLTVNFYKRNYIEGLFLSSGVWQSPDKTMELLIEVARKLRKEEKYNGYIHMKVIPGASQELVNRLASHVDRLSVNIELPTSQSLLQLAPEKKYSDIIKPMSVIKDGIAVYREEKKKYKHREAFAPAGQTTQMIVGAGDETDLTILTQAESLYKNQDLKRVYYSAFVPVKTSKLLKDVAKAPLTREHRIYQSDFLMRFYYFHPSEILSEENPDLDLEMDPKVTWALRHLEEFPKEVNAVDYRELLRIPGIGPISARRIVSSRKLAALNYDDLKRIGVVLKRAKYFITVRGKYYGDFLDDEKSLRQVLTEKKQLETGQLSFLD